MPARGSASVGGATTAVALMDAGEGADGAVGAVGTTAGLVVADAAASDALLVAELGM